MVLVVALSIGLLVARLTMRGLGELIAVCRLHDVIEVKAVSEFARAIDFHHFTGSADSESIDIDLKDGWQFAYPQELLSGLLAVSLMLVGVLPRELLSRE